MQEQILSELEECLAFDLYVSCMVAILLKACFIFKSSTVTFKQLILSSELKRDKNLNKTWTLWLD